MLSQISLEDLVVMLTVVCAGCVIVSAALFAFTIHLLLRLQKRLEIERRPYVVRDDNGAPIFRRK